VPGHHRDRHLAANGVHGVEVVALLANIADYNRAALARGHARDALSERDEQIMDHLFAVADGVANSERLQPFRYNSRMAKQLVRL